MTASSDEEHWCHAIGYCAGWTELEAKPGDDTWTRLRYEQALAARQKALPFRQHYHDDGHPTKEEAERCWRRYLRDQKIKFRSEPAALVPCVECDWEQRDLNYTDGRAALTGAYTMSREVALCPQHQTVDVAIRHLWPEPTTSGSESAAGGTETHD